MAELETLDSPTLISRGIYDRKIRNCRKFHDIINQILTFGGGVASPTDFDFAHISESW